MSWQTLAIAEVFLMVVPGTTLPIIYGCFWPWRHHREGRAIMTLATGLGSLVDFAVLYNLFPDAPLRPVVASFVYGVILFALAYMNFALLASWRERRERH